MTIHEEFEAQVRIRPEAVAVVYEDEHLSYAALNQRTNQLARYLQQRGVGPEVRVGICMERSLHLVVALLSVLKVGGSYVPLDPAYPQHRLDYILEDSQAAVLITQRQLIDRLPSGSSRARSSTRCGSTRRSRRPSFNCVRISRARRVW